VLPGVKGHRNLSVWRIDQWVFFPRPLPCLDHRYLFADADHGITKAINLFQRLGFSWLDHQGSRAGENPRRRMKAVVDEPLGDIFYRDAAGLGQLAQIEDALMRDPAAAAGIQHRVMITEPPGDVVRG